MATLSLADARDRRLVKSLRSMVSAGLDCLAILEDRGDDEALREHAILCAKIGIGIADTMKKIGREPDLGLIGEQFGAHYRRAQERFPR